MPMTKDPYAVNSASTGPIRHHRKATTTTTTSPITTRSGRALAASPGKASTAATFSPYTRRPITTLSNSQAQPFVDEEEQDDDEDSSKQQAAGGLVNLVKGFPGKALGFLFRSASTRSLSTSNSSVDLARAGTGPRGADEEENAIESTGAARGRGLPQRSSSTAGNSGVGMRTAAAATINYGASPSNLLNRTSSFNDFHMPRPSPLSSAAAAAAVVSPPPRSSKRAAHSTLTIPHSTAPAFLTRAASSRGGSPARSVSYAGSNASDAGDVEGHGRNRLRSPSPTRLGGSSSAFLFNDARPTSSPFAQRTSSSVGRSNLHGISNSNKMTGSTSAYGLTSRSPFARSPSLASIYDSPGSAPLPRSQSGRSLFPYSSTVPRGTAASPSASRTVDPFTVGTTSSGSAKRSHSQFAASDIGPPASPSPRFAANGGNSSVGGSALRRSTAMGSSSLNHTFIASPRASSSSSSIIRAMSPLNPGYGYQPQEQQRFQQQQQQHYPIEEMSGAERARKRQLIWDPEQGYASRDGLDKELAQERERRMPKNDAERILERLEDLRPMGTMASEAQRRSIHVPATIIPVSTTAVPTRFASAYSAPSAFSPYTRRSNPTGSSSSDIAAVARSGTGLMNVLQAREDRRRAAEEANRIELRAKERDERSALRKEEYERDRAEAREDDAAPRRKTRSMAKASSSSTTTTTMATPGKASRSSAAIKSPTKSSRRGRSRKAVESDDESVSRSVAVEEEREPEIILRSTRSRRVKSPTPPPPPPARTILHPSPSASNSTTSSSSAFPVTAPVQSTSSLRPGRTHTSRSHVASSRVFSARQEDLPPVEEGTLDKIKLPAMVFPTGFSFGDAASAAVVVTKADETKNSSAGNSLIARLDAAPLASVSTPHSALQPVTTFSVSVVSPSVPVVPIATAPVSASDFFSRPSAPALLALPPSNTAATGTPKILPNFFGSTPVAAALPPVAPLPSFSFSKPVEEAVAAPTEVVQANVSNPFAAFGKPIASIIEESKGLTKSTAPSDNKPAASPFSFGAAPSSTAALASSSAPTAAGFSFGASTSSSLFSFNAPTAAPTLTLADMPSLSEEKDEDSGMEDHSAPSTAIALLPRPSSSSSTGTAPAFTFGLSTAAAAAPSPFGTTTATPTTSFFGAPSAAAAAATSPFGSSSANLISPFGGFGSTATTPAQSPAALAGAFTFGSTASSVVPSSASPFMFGATSTPAPAPLTNIFGSNPSSTTTGFQFGAVSANGFGSAMALAPALSRTGSSSSNGPFGGGNNGNGGGGFGGSASSVVAAVPSFSFGGATASPFSFTSSTPSATSNMPSTAPSSFAFGAATTTAPTTTNFFATGSAPGSPAPAPGGGGAGGMFNLGSGGGEEGANSGAPKGRKIVGLRKRK